MKSGGGVDDDCVKQETTEPFHVLIFCVSSSGMCSC